jgi:L-iditol 2-dehydrogenase
MGSGELLVKVVASGLCGSDVMEWYRIKKAPLVLGHEIAGEIVEVGKEVEKYKVGDRVFVSHHVPCNTCRYCLRGQHTVCHTLHTTNFDPGGFAEVLRVPRINVDRGVFHLPEEMSYDEGTFLEPLGCVVRGLRLARLQPGQTVLVLGSGISGLLQVALARALGAGRIVATDISEYRLSAARRFGADVVFRAEEDVPSRLRQVNEDRLADLVIVCTGAFPAFTQALQSADHGGTVLFFAPTEPGVDLSVPVNDFWRNQMTLMTSYGAAPEDIVTAIQLIRTKRVPVHEMITHRLPLDEIGEGFRLVAEADESIKVIVEPHR